LDLYERCALVRSKLRLHSHLLTCNRGEKGIGKWTITLRDTKVDENNGTFIDCHLKLWGAALDASKAKLLPMPTEDDDANHDKIATTTQEPSTTTLPADPNATNSVVDPTALPSDHPNRPTKPTGAGGSTASGTADTIAEATSTASSWLPSFLPTFGASPHTLAWIYGAIGLISLFVIGLGAWWWIVRRRRLRNSPRDDYEFELLNEEEGEGLAGGAEKPPKRRGGELYDAFAGGSEDEDDDDDDSAERDIRRQLDSDSEEEEEVTDEKQSSRLLGGKH
jgi:kexin